MKAWSIHIKCTWCAEGLVYCLVSFTLSFSDVTTLQKYEEITFSYLLSVNYSHSRAYTEMSVEFYQLKIQFLFNTQNTASQWSKL